MHYSRYVGHYSHVHHPSPEEIEICIILPRVVFVFGSVGCKHRSSIPTWTLHHDNTPEYYRRPIKSPPNIVQWRSQNAKNLNPKKKFKNQNLTRLIL